MERPIDAARVWLGQQYSDLGLELVDLASRYDPVNPVYIPVDCDLNQVDAPIENALILDPQIGTALFLLNFTSHTDMRAQIARAIGFRSQLLPHQIDANSADHYGSWRIVLHWFVEDTDKELWIDVAARLRQDTAYLEELPIDAIFNEQSEWEDAIDEHGLPRLLIHTRNVLSMKSGGEVFHWSNADEKVRKALYGFATNFKNTLEQEYAKQVEQSLNQERKKGKESPVQAAKEAKKLFHFGVKSFRNLQHIDLRFPGHDPQVAVIHGPNGTGKSNLLEALEFALTGFSRRAQKFVKDKDVSTTKRVREYRDRYLYPIDNSGEPPCVDLNEENLPVLSGDDMPSMNALIALSANVLNQETSREFIEKAAEELAGEIVGEFSDLAYRAIDFAGQQHEKSRAGKQRLLAELGITRQVTRTDTAYRKAAERKLLEAVAQPRSILDWFRRPELEFSPSTVGAIIHSESLEAWSNTAEGFAIKLTASERSSTAIADIMRDFLLGAWGDLRKASQFIEHVKKLSNSWQDNLPDQVELWGVWLAKQAHEEENQPKGTDESSSKEKERSELEKRLAEIAKEGRVFSEREEHFERLSAFLERTWSKYNPNHCPTCDSDLSARGGIMEVIRQVQSENRVKRDELRTTYRETQDKLDVIVKELGRRAKTRCPIGEEEQAAIRKTLTPHLPADANLMVLLTDQQRRSMLIEWIRVIQQLPIAPSTVDQEKEGQSIATISEEIVQIFRNIETSFAAPSAWDRVVKQLKKQLAGVLDQHLPATLGGLWRELVLNLTPAPWQMPGRLDIRLESRRGNNWATIDLKTDENPRLARYVLNYAETHALGLAWFLVRYLTEGRFQYALLVMDDPAQEMDQPTYRDLCRLIETLLRLHKIMGYPLTALLMLHQDERALDVARASGALLYRLKWNRGRSDVANSIRLYSPEHRHPLPEVILSSKENSPVKES